MRWVVLALACVCSWAAVACGSDESGDGAAAGGVTGQTGGSGAASGTAMGGSSGAGNTSGSAGVQANFAAMGLVEGTHWTRLDFATTEAHASTVKDPAAAAARADCID